MLHTYTHQSYNNFGNYKTLLSRRILHNDDTIKNARVTCIDGAASQDMVTTIVFNTRPYGKYRYTFILQYPYWVCTNLTIVQDLPYDTQSSNGTLGHSRYLGLLCLYNLLIIVNQSNLLAQLFFVYQPCG